jgi:transcriptional regulator with XRE-family HTH domain
VQSSSLNLRQQFGKRILELRKQRNLTQEQFAEVLGISVDFLSLMERGINAPSFETLERMTEALQISVRDLFTFRLATERGHVRRSNKHGSAPA